MKVLLFVRRSILVIGVAVLVALAAPAQADFINLPVKWSQPIVYDTNGVILLFDLSSDHTITGVKADDFISDGRPIVAVRWWGSYIGETNQRPDGFTFPFDISFHLSDGAPHPTSLPSTLLALYTVPAQEVFVGIDQGGDFVYRYDAFLPQPFFETNSVEYFIDIDKPTGEKWGWHMTPILTNDWAALAPGHFGPWASLTGDSLAFELMVPEPSTVLLAGIGLLGLWWCCKRQKTASG